MKVLFVCSANSHYGISPIVKNQANSLKEAGLSVEYFGIKGKGLYGYLRNVRPLKRILAQNNYQIIHAHYGFSGILAVLARRREKIVVSFMGSDVLLDGKYSLNYLLKYKTEIILNGFFSRRFFSHVIVKSEQMFDRLPGVKKKSIVPNGVNLDMFYPIPREEARSFIGLAHNTKLILFSSDPARPEKNYPLAELAVKLANLSNVKMIALKGIEQKKLKYYYNAADLLLMTSFFEGSPNVIKESMACNCPIVTTNVGDVEKVIGSTDGCYISSFDPADVAEKIKKALVLSKRTNGRQQIIDLGLEDKVIAGKLQSIYLSLAETT